MVTFLKVGPAQFLMQLWKALLHNQYSVASKVARVMDISAHDVCTAFVALAFCPPDIEPDMRRGLEFLQDDMAT